MNYLALRKEMLEEYCTLGDPLPRRIPIGHEDLSKMLSWKNTTGLSVTASVRSAITLEGARTIAEAVGEECPAELLYVHREGLRTPIVPAESELLSGGTTGASLRLHPEILGLLVCMQNVGGIDPTQAVHNGMSLLHGLSQHPDYTPRIVEGGSRTGFVTSYAIDAPGSFDHFRGLGD